MEVKRVLWGVLMRNEEGRVLDGVVGSVCEGLFRMDKVVREQRIKQRE